MGAWLQAEGERHKESPPVFPCAGMPHTCVDPQMPSPVRSCMGCWCPKCSLMYCDTTSLSVNAATTVHNLGCVQKHRVVSTKGVSITFVVCVSIMHLYFVRQSTPCGSAMWPGCDA